MRHRHLRFTRAMGGIACCALLVLTTLATPASAEPGDAQWDPTLPKIVSSGAPGDPVAIANASLEVSRLATQTTMELGRKFLSSLGIGGETAVPPSAVPGRLTGVRGSQAIEYVIRRGGLPDRCSLFLGRWQAERTVARRGLRREHRGL